MKKTIVLIFLFIFNCQTDMFAKVGGGISSGARSSSFRSSSYRSSSSSSKIRSSSSSSSSKTTRVSSKNYSKVGSGGSRGIRSFKKTSTSTKSISKYTSSKPFAKPKTITTSKYAHHQVSFVYTRPVIFYNPYYYHSSYHSYRPDSAKVDTTAFPGFGKGKSGGAGASASFADSLQKHTSKDTLEITDLQPINYLSDYASIIPDKDEAKINSIIRHYKKKTGVEIAVLTIPTLGDEIDMEDYIQVIFDKWGVGESGVNNGVLMIISSEDEILRIQPGYGMEEFLPDITCRQIEDEITIPLCEKEQWEEAVTSSVNDIIKRLGDKPVEIMKQELAARKKKQHEEMMNVMYITFEVLGVFALAIIAFFIFKKKTRDY